jgi:hypothetical protein
MGWRAFADAGPELAAFGKERLHDQVAYLATVHKNGSPRLHPVRPIVSDSHLFVFMEPTSPKAQDLRRDGRYALHCTATGSEPWDLREFGVEGRGALVADSALRQVANAATSFQRDEHFLLFELGIESAFSTLYGADGQPVRRRWRKHKGSA